MILSIESSCDDSAIALTSAQDYRLHFHKKISQDLQHSFYGGVVPELAARLHIKALPNILKEALKYKQNIKAVAVTTHPGLLVSLVEGVMMAKALAISLNIPLISVNHLKGHIYSLFIEKEESLPIIALLISGGHTQIIEVKSYEKQEILASSMDDSFGESFDKVAKMLGLGYPGGPVVEKLAKDGDEGRFDFTIPLQNSPKLAFSYSGLKNQVRVEIERLGDLSQKNREDIAASFQRVATKHLLQKTKKILKKSSIKKFALIGGASANLYVREEFGKLCEELDKEILFAPLEFCTDNAAMIGRVGVEAYKRGDFTKIEELKAYAG